MESKSNEVWPFFDESSGIQIQEARFYGFGDSGSLAGSAEGYANREEAIAAICVEYDCEPNELGTSPCDLGDYATTVLSGREFVDRLKEVCEGGGDLSEYGRWANDVVDDTDN